MALTRREKRHEKKTRSVWGHVTIDRTLGILSKKNSKKNMQEEKEGNILGTLYCAFKRVHITQVAVGGKRFRLEKGEHLLERKRNLREHTLGKMTRLSPLACENKEITYIPIASNVVCKIRELHGP